MANWEYSNTLVFKKLNLAAIIPTRATPFSAGFDLYASVDMVINAGKYTPIPTGIAVQFPPGIYGQICSRSGNTIKIAATVGAGVIDADYTGELKVCLTTLGPDPVLIPAGFKIAQLVPLPYSTAGSVEGEFAADRPGGHVGFGSTGESAATSTVAPPQPSSFT